MSKNVITFPNFGNYTVAFKLLCEDLGIEAILPEKTNSRQITEGAKLSPEMYCFPFKVNLGNYLSAIEKGANTILMATASGGSCRLRYYGIVQEKMLKENGHNVNFIIFDQSIKDIYRKIKEISGLSFWKILKITISFYKKLRFIENLEEKARYLRPRELKKGMTDKIFNESLLKLEKAGSENFEKTKKEILEKFSKIEIKKDTDFPRVGLVGEIFTVCDPFINFEVEKKLGKLGIEVHREINLSYHLKKKIFFTDFFIQRKIKHYLASSVGGHGRDAIYEMLKYVKKGFDGVIQLMPMACMPESTVRPILEKIHQQTKIPFLSLSFDEQVAEAGIDTRLEAFADVVWNYHNNRH
jgi:predicted nucleotide-binding protein (sugar kinase/HSP70/actin superfamily)